MKRLAIVLAAVLVAALPGTAARAGRLGEPRRTRQVEDGYIVVYRDSVAHPAASTRALGRSEGFNVRLTYTSALKGFAASLTTGQVRSLRAHPKVEFVAPDRPVWATEVAPLAAGDSAPTGVRRIEAATTSAVRSSSPANVAVIDTGIDLEHPDLNAMHGVNCTGSGPAQDDNGHGTHVAGTIGARNDGAGVVGVVPATKLYAAKVLRADGSGTTSGVICGIDWVTSTRTDADTTNDISVANMSLGGPGAPVQSCSTTTDPQHRAICRSVAAGVTYVVAAGNDGWDFDYSLVPDVPAAYPEVLTVTAMSDGDGTSGGSTSPSCAPSLADDAYASYSNYAATAAGAAHTVAGPGTCIRSTVPGGYGTMSGTSMATPHVAGTVALCLGEAGVAGPCSGLTAAQIAAKIRGDAEARPADYGFVGDPRHPVSGRYYGYLVWARPDAVPPSVTSTAPSADAVGADPGTAIAVTFSETMNRSSAEAAFSLTKASDGSAIPGVFTWSGNTMIFTPAARLAEGTYYGATVQTAARDAAGNPLAEAKTWSFKTITNVVAAPGATTILWGSWRSGGLARLAYADDAYYELNSTTSSPYGAAYYGRFGGVTNSLRNLRFTYKGRISRSCTQTLALWHWTTSSWVEVDSRIVGSTPVFIDKAAGGAPADYVSGASGDGELRLRVRCQTSGSFILGGDLMKISYGRP